MGQLLDKEISGHRQDLWWKHRGDDGKEVITLHTIEDVEPIIRANRRQFNDAPKAPRRNETFRKVASIPTTVIEEFCRLKQIPFREFMQQKTDRAQAGWKELLNDSKFRSFRTHPGRV